MLGNFIALGVFLCFQVCGIIAVFSFLNKNSFTNNLLIGSVLGSVMLQWLPCVFAFVIGFNIVSHILALISAAGLCVYLVRKNKPYFKFVKPNIAVFGLSFSLFLCLCLLALHSFRINESGVYSSQCTYGDMNMHLGFITSIAKSKTFPPVYSIFPYEKLSYPFLCDSISSSLYVFGATLRFSYLLPMFFAFAQVIAGFVNIMRIWLKDDKKVLLSMVLFFLNGGFGIFYFINKNFGRIFTAFYETPTNYTVENVSWVNVMVDMLIPQRATLFGWAVLFACITLLLQKSKNNFIVLGVLAGSLPLIHTHSFLVLAIISACYLVTYKNSEKAIKCLLLVFPLFFFILQFFTKGKIGYLMPLSLVLVAIILALSLAFAFKNGAKISDYKIWLVYLAITLCLALPQLIGFTFTQSQGFVQSYFNWNNNKSDGYIWFYIKNLGLMALFYYPSVIFAKKRSLRIACPIIIIMLLSEMIVFQPNVYDNNKLIFVAYLFLCGLVSEFICDKMVLKKLHWAILIFIFTISALLTIAREFNASYELYGKDAVAFSEYVKENSNPDDIFLTNDRHNNEISTLTGRNIACGSPSYLYFHGVDYMPVANKIKLLYESPVENFDYFEELGIDYVVISAHEINRFNVNLEEIESLFDLVFENSSIKLYKVA